MMSAKAFNLHSMKSFLKNKNGNIWFQRIPKKRSTPNEKINTHMYIYTQKHTNRQTQPQRRVNTTRVFPGCVAPYPLECAHSNLELRAQSTSSLKGPCRSVWSRVGSLLCRAGTDKWQRSALPLLQCSGVLWALSAALQPKEACDPAWGLLLFQIATAEQAEPYAASPSVYL